MSTRAFLGGSASDPAVKLQRSVAIAVTAFATMLTVLLLPFAREPGPTIPGFIPMYQACLVIAYGLGGWVVLTQFLRERSLPLLLVACGALYTAEIVVFQLLSFPGVFGSAVVLGAGSETTTWLWTFWHIGPPVFALAYAWARLRPDRHSLSSESSRQAAFWAVLFSLLASGAALLTASFGLKWLPKQVSGNDYSALVTSGVGPAVQILTIVALLAAWMATRARQTVLDLWIAVALVLLVLDNFLTMRGGSRDSIGWCVGRIEALVSAFAILWAYLSEVDGLRVRAEAFAEEAERTGAALRQGQKMEAIGRLTGGIAHDFNNLLMVISSGFDMIIRRPADQARVLKTAEMGREAAERGARLTRQLMTFAHKQNLTPETLNLNTSLVEFEALARRALGDAVTFKMDLYPALHLIRVDRGELESAVLNLVVNSRDALKDHPAPQVHVATRNDTRSISGAASNSCVVVSVADNGLGMDDVTRAKAFEPFFTTKEFGKGSGLGLSQVYGFARGAGGDVEIASAVGEGTTVEIWLPKTVEPARLPTRTAGNNAPLNDARTGEVVLAVEDEPAVLSVIVENLAEIGYKVLAANDAAEAMSFLRGEDRIDILFSDVVMPGGMNGLQLAVEARRPRPGLRVLLTSGYTGEALAGEHKMPNNVFVLSKPYGPEQLAEQLTVV